MKITRQGQVTVAELLDEDILEEGVIKEITQALFSLTEAEKPIQLLLNFARVRRMSSDALGTLIRLSKRINESGGILKLCCFKPTLYKILVITKVNKIFDIHEDAKAALDSYDQQIRGSSWP